MTEQGTILWVTFTFWQEARTRKAILRNFPSDTRLRFAPILKVTFTNLQRTLTWLNDWAAGVCDRKERKMTKFFMKSFYSKPLLAWTSQTNKRREKRCSANAERTCRPLHLPSPEKPQFLVCGHHCTPFHAKHLKTILYTVCSMSSAHFIEMLDNGHINVLIQQKCKIALLKFQKMAQVLKKVPNFV